MRPDAVRTGVVAAIWAWTAVLPAAADQDRQITIRGDTMTVWPADDLRARGFDVQDVPEAENAAWTYIEAINTYADLPDELDDIFRYAYGTTWPSHRKAKALEKWLTSAENCRAMELAHKASRMDRCQFPYFGDSSESVMAVMLPSLSHYRFLTKMLVADGRRLEAAGRFEQAWNNYTTTYRMGGHVARGITLIDGLVGIACTALADGAIKAMALRQDLPPALLERLLADGAELADLRPGIRRGLELERLFSTSIVDEFVSRPTALPANLSAMGGNWGPLSMNLRADSGWGALEARIGRLMLPDRTIKRHMAAYYDEVDRRSKLPAHQADWQAGWDQELIQSIPIWDGLARLLLPSLSRAAELAERLRAATRMTQVVTALRVYAVRNKGAVPQRLEDLSDLLDDPDVLTDPFSGNHFVYRVESKGWVLYSAGGNLTDDGGTGPALSWREKDFVCRYPPADAKEFED